MEGALKHESVLIFAYPCCARSTKLPLKPTLEFSGERYPIGIRQFDCVAHTQECSDESSNLDEAFLWGDPGVHVGCEHAQGVVVLMAWLAKVSPLLLVPPIRMWITKLSLNRRRLNVATVLHNRKSSVPRSQDPQVALLCFPSQQLIHTWFGS